jgi:hypothetical protein
MALHRLSGYMSASLFSQFRGNLFRRCLAIFSNPLTDRFTVYGRDLTRLVITTPMLHTAVLSDLGYIMP